MGMAMNRDASTAKAAYRVVQQRHCVEMQSIVLQRQGNAGCCYTELRQCTVEFGKGRAEKCAAVAKRSNVVPRIIKKLHNPIRDKG